MSNRLVSNYCPFEQLRKRSLCNKVRLTKPAFGTTNTEK